MAHLCKIFVLSLIIIVISVPNMAQGITQEPKAVESWFEKLPNAKEKITKLHFYYHDTVSGKHPSVVTLANPNVSSTGFGLFVIMDNALTTGPEPSSKIVGRAEGLYVLASLEEVSLLMAMNFVFTQGKYKGSSLSVLGSNPFFNEYREMPVIGGSGAFRLARGIATTKTVWYNYTSMDALTEYNVVLLHY